METAGITTTSTAWWRGKNPHRASSGISTLLTPPKQFQTTWCFWRPSNSNRVPRDPAILLDLSKDCGLLKPRQFLQKGLQQSHFRGRKHISFLDSKKWSSPVLEKTSIIMQSQGPHRRKQGRRCGLPTWPFYPPPSQGAVHGIPFCNTNANHGHIQHHLPHRNIFQYVTVVPAQQELEGGPTPSSKGGFKGGLKG